jgi:GTPase SAR1 family protein
MWDVGGQATKLWKHYFDHIDAVIFVVDSADEEKLLFAKEELSRLVKDEGLTEVPFLLYYNKQDMMGKCKGIEELNSRLECDSIKETREIAV